jgi:hypothetical protein
MATAAAAYGSGEYKIQGLTFSAANVLAANVEGTVDEGELLTEGGIEIWCEGGTVSGTVFKGGNGEAQVLYKGCKVLGTNFCTIYPTHADQLISKNKGHITAQGSGLALLHGGGHYFEAQGATFTTIYFDGDFCVLPVEASLGGSVVFRLPTALQELLEQAIESVNEETRTLIGVQMFLGKEKAHLREGDTALVMLVTPNYTWGAR